MLEIFSFTNLGMTFGFVLVIFFGGIGTIAVVSSLWSINSASNEQLKKTINGGVICLIVAIVIAFICKLMFG